jgi:hypothetical protein
MNTQNSDDRREPLSEQDLRESALATWEEFLRHKWRMGVALGYDPEDDRSINELFADWIAQHASSFRQHWEAQRRQRQSL